HRPAPRPRRRDRRRGRHGRVDRVRGARRRRPDAAGAGAPERAPRRGHRAGARRDHRPDQVHEPALPVRLAHGRRSLRADVAGEPAYTVSVSPKHDGGLLGSAQLAWDAVHGVPLKLAIYAQGASTPVLALEATDISFGPVADADVDVSPPAGAKVVDATPPA